ncbi:Glycolate dehydrogenase, FAD-binding subunit GlcE [hydrothermal vent metagenome]|uniref:Glycolate dehydrogenase, FAD-binding subunit GlcE n=1 Tax=hydrothermal vent metagenome TaxID=652676 RepID=A0A3B1A0Z3_9ZZZZ
MGQKMNTLSSYDNCNVQQLQDQVLRALNEQMPLNIVGGNSKHFLGQAAQEKSHILDTRSHRGIIEYDPRELVLTARTGTPLNEIEAALADNGQMLPFEPPHFSGEATLGGAIACGLSGPRRPYAGAARDLVLGCKLLDGRGEILRFGGQVMKNVAGYDISRLMAGAYGTLGVLLEISIKVLPRPTTSITHCHASTPEEAIRFMSSLLRRALPVDALCYYKGQCYVRLSSGSEQAVLSASKEIPGDVLSDKSHFWQRLRDHQLSFFQSDTSLWRITCKPATAPIKIKDTKESDWLLDWGGAQRWLVSNMEPNSIRTAISNTGGYATCFRRNNNSEPIDLFQPLSQPMLALHQRLKASFDPQKIFNPGRMYSTL